MQNTFQKRKPQKASRQAFGEALVRLGEQCPNLVVLDADLSKSTMSKFFGEKFPERFFEMGIAEPNMVGVAAGLAACGKIPFICSFACFVTGRYETIRISVAYARLPVHIVGTHAGLGTGEDGNSQMGLEDVSIMRSLPHMAVIQPADDVETQRAVEYMVSHTSGPTYLRLTRQKLPQVNPVDYQFRFGHGTILREGDDITVFATGGTVGHALDAADWLSAEEGLSVRVVNIATIKPIDRRLIVQCANETKALFTVEDHNIIGGLGSAVCEVVAENGSAVPVKRWGLLDAFGESGSPDALYHKYHLDADGIAAELREYWNEVSSL